MNESYVPDSSPGATIVEGRIREVVVPADLRCESIRVRPVVEPIGLGSEQRVQVALIQAVHRVVRRVVITVMPSRPISSST